MRARIAIGLVAVMLVVGGACRREALRHDPRMAADKATAFLVAAAVKQDLAGAYQMLREQDRTVPEDRFASIIRAKHAKGFPTEVAATEFEPVAGDVSAINVFLQGKNADASFFYRIRVVGTAESGYFPQGLLVEDLPFPSSPARKALVPKPAQN